VFELLRREIVVGMQVCAVFVWGFCAGKENKSKIGVGGGAR
jgi:hypothetical protein